MRARLALTAAAVTAMIVLAFCIPLARLIQVVAANRALEAAKLESRSLAGAVSAVPGQPATIAQLVEQANAGSPRPITVYLPDGTVLGPQVPAGAEVELARQGRSFTAAGPGGGRDIFVGIVGTEPRASAVVRVRVAASLLSRGVQRAWAIVAVIGALVVIVAVGLADRLALSIVRPMGELLSVTRRLQRGELEARVSPAGPPEVAEVGLAVNGLADRIGDLLAAEREEAADLSHQLRTPLTALRLDAEGLASDEDRLLIARDVDRLEQVVTRVIQESRRSSRHQGASHRRGSCDLGQVVRHRLAFWSILASDQGRQLTVNVPNDPQPIGLSQAELEVCLDALVNNVLAHTPGGTPFSVEVRTGSNRQWMLAVQDAGPGLPGNVLPARGASSGSGTGLGLDIVRRTAEASGGHLSARRSPGGGTRIEVSFGPARDRP
ncbi:MAG: HAMP domain-containing histidine kinase [Actinomycetota bacterium]|nr:HAMP domain-containing histidine kinase [Actinomycetota bacterium]MDQ3680364.1 HAMP domain-containing histidine kinase [Actinomycetota bacterium]